MLSLLQTIVRRTIAKPPALPGNSAAQAPSFEIAGRWGPFELRERLGQGAFGEVWRAWQPTLDREVALKLLKSHHDLHLNEARCMARVSHPNVVTVYDAGVWNDVCGLWMQLLDGTTLAHRVQTSGPRRAAEVLCLGRDLCAGLHAITRPNSCTATSAPKMSCAPCRRRQS